MVEMGSMKACAPYFAMVVMQFAYCGSIVLGKLALEQGLSYIVLVVYRHLIATAIFAPLAYAFERKHRPLLSWPILGRLFVLALFGVTINQNVYYLGLIYASPTVASAMSNVAPALTFVLAVLLRMERVRIRTAESRAKIMGTIVCIGGALILTFWKGYRLGGFIQRPLIVVHGHGKASHSAEDWVKGSALILASYIAFCAWLILQAMVYKVYPARLSMNAFICFFGALQSSALALIFKRNASAWRLDWNIQLLTIVYSGIVISGLAYYLQTYCISERGPVFVAIFSPLLLVAVMIFSAFFLAERFYLGSLVGAFIIIVGLYSVLWGKSKELKNVLEEKDGKEQDLQKSSTQTSTSNDDCHLP